MEKHVVNVRTVKIIRLVDLLVNTAYGQR